jgi:hypothetical protein
MQYVRHLAALADCRLSGEFDLLNTMMLLMNQRHECLPDVCIAQKGVEQQQFRAHSSPPGSDPAEFPFGFQILLIS